jgi:hypothetical protein
MKYMHALLLSATTLLASSQGAAQNAAGYIWDSMSIGGGGFVSAVIPSKTQSGLMYARTDVGGAYRWDNSAQKWVSLLDWVSDNQNGYLGVESLAVDPNNSANVSMLVGISYFNGGSTAILRSTNYGASFTITDVSSQFKAHGNGMGRQNGERLSYDPGNSNTLYVGTRRDGLFKSTNGGANWSRVTALNVTSTPNDNGISFLALDPQSTWNGAAQRMFVGVSRFGSVGPNLYVSTNGGASFSAVSGSPSNMMPQRAVYDGTGNIYITYANGAGPHGNSSGSEPMNQGQIWKYNYGNNSWTNVTPAGVTAAFSGIDIAPGNNQRLVASSINLYAQQGNAWGDRIYISNNGGASWTDVIARGFAKNTGGVTWIADKSIHWAGSIVFNPFNGKEVLVTSGNGIFKTSDIDATTTTWTFNVKGLEETVPLGLYSIPGGPVLSVIGDYDGFRHYTLNTYNPIHTPSIGTTTGLAVADANTSFAVRVGNSMYYSQNGGVNWTQTGSMNGTKGQVALSANGGVLLHSPENSTTTYRSLNNGSSWSNVWGLSTANVRPVGDPVNSAKFYLYNNGAFMTSTDWGASFSTKANLPAGGSNVIRAAPGREGDIWVPLNGGGLARSTNSGTSFTNLANISYCGAVGFGKAATGATYPTVFIWGTVNGVKGVHRSTNAGASWTRINDDAHEYGGPANGQFIVGDMNTFGLVYMSSAGRGIVYGKPN